MRDGAVPLHFPGDSHPFSSGRSEKQRKADVKKAVEMSPEKTPKKSSKENRKLSKEAVMNRRRLLAARKEIKMLQLRLGSGLLGTCAT